MKRPKASNNEIYHVYNRGVEKRKIFMEEADYLRFIHDLFEFNDSNPAFKLFIPNKFSEIGLPKMIETKEKKPRKLLVDLFAFCLMPNHFHLLVRQKTKNGITEFMRKIGTGYTNYFNQKYQRVGPLFQGKYKIVHVKQYSQLLHILYYIHLNPLDLCAPKWREQTIEDHKKAMDFLQNYRWSSFLDYIGHKNFPAVTQRKYFLNILGQPEEYKRETIKWLEELNIESIKSITLE